MNFAICGTFFAQISVEGMTAGMHAAHENETQTAQQAEVLPIVFVPRVN